MTRTLTLTADDGPRFDLLYTGFLMGGNTLHPNARSRDERKKEAKILRALKAISKEPWESDLSKGPKRDLSSDGGTLVLEQDQLDLLIKYVEACPFNTHISDVVDDLIDWLYAAPTT